VTLEAQPLRTAPATVSGWRITILPRARGADPAGPDASDAQLRRLRTLLDVPGRAVSDLDDGQFFYALALRAAGPKEDVTGMLEIAKPADVDPTGDDLERSLVLIALIVVVTTLMVGSLAFRFVSRPITKLLRGIDDVAKGDLSHVILSERDDEIGRDRDAVQRDDVLAARVARGDAAAERGEDRARAARGPRARSSRRSVSSRPRSRTRSARRST